MFISRRNLEYWNRLSRRHWLQWTGLSLLASGSWHFTRQPSNACTPPAGAKLRARAVVIGIDDYDGKYAPLMQPVSHALAFTEWLINQAGVKDTDIWLLTRPTVGQPAVVVFGNTQVVCRDATTDALEEAIEALSTAAGDQAERFYFFFSGHGTARPISSFDSNAAAPIDDAKDMLILANGRGFEVSAIQGAVSEGHFTEQFYFIDACREKNNRVKFFVAGLAPATNCSSNVNKFRFILNTTQPGKEAPASSHVVDLLLRVLKNGDGYCLTWEGGKFVVRWNRLKEFFVQWFAHHKIPIRPGDTDYIKPHITTHPACSDLAFRDSPCLVDLQTIQPRTVEVRVVPLNMLGDASYEVHRQDNNERVVAGKVPANGEFQFVADAGDHILTVSLPGGVKRVRPFNVLDFNLIAPLEISFEPTRSIATVDVPFDMSSFLAEPQGNGELRIHTKSPIAQVQLFDATTGLPVLKWNSGPIVNLGPTRITGLKPGPYQAVLSTERQIRAMSTWIDSNSIASLSFPDIVVDSLPNGEVPNDSIASYLPYALQAASGRVDAALVISKNEALQERLRGQEGIRIVLGVGLDAPEPNQDAVKQVRLRVGDLQGELEELPPLGCVIVGAETFAIARPPGPFRLQMLRRTPNGMDVAEFAGVLLPGRIGEWIINISMHGPVRLSQFSPPLRPEQAISRDFAMKLHLLEQDLHDGPPERPRLLLEQLLQTTVREPISLALAAYLFSQSSNIERQIGLAGNLMELAPQLPDGYVALGIVAEQQGDTKSAAGHFHAALEHGLPILSPLFKELVQGARRCRVEHERMRLLLNVWKNFLPGPLWTAWRPFSE